MNSKPLYCSPKFHSCPSNLHSLHVLPHASISLPHACVEIHHRLYVSLSLKLPNPIIKNLRERLRFAESEGRWWSRPFRAIKKLREWSEIVAGPKWKTFIRRFNRNRSGGGGGRQGDFQYDPFSYYPDFTSQYVSGSLSSKTSMDLGRTVPAAVLFGAVSVASWLPKDDGLLLILERFLAMHVTLGCRFSPNRYCHPDKSRLGFMLCSLLRWFTKDDGLLLILKRCCS